jgi:hypothetical protein
MNCPMHPRSGHKLKDCYNFNSQYRKDGRYNDNQDRRLQEPKKEEKKPEGDFQEPQKQLYVIFS